MKKRILCVLALALIAIGNVPSAMAQSPSAQGYVVQPGDTLWRLSGDYLGDPVKWGRCWGPIRF